MILAIDPGTTQSAYVLFDGEKPVEADKLPNGNIRSLIKSASNDLSVDGGSMTLVVEMIASYGMPVGREVFETVLWIGRFLECWEPRESALVYRKDVKMHLCHNVRAKDSNILQAIYDRFGPGRQMAVGTKKEPGPCYGLSGDMWAALAVALTYYDTRVDLPAKPF